MQTEDALPGRHAPLAAKSASRWLPTLRRHWDLYLIMVPGILYFLVYKYLPMAGIVIAFQDYGVFAGIRGSEWVGLEHFKAMFTDRDFYEIFKNTLIISFYKLIWGFPGPIILAIMLNEIRSMLYKRSIQTLIYLPHFLSWVIIGGVLVNLLSPTSGLVNELLKWLGFEPIFFLADPNWFRSILVVSDLWKEIGWGAIVYLAAIAGIDPQLYEAAIMDGAGKWKQIIHITLPSMMSTIVIMLLLRLGHILDVGFEQIFILYSPLVYDVSDVIQTYVYRMGITQAEFSFTTAVGLFESVVGLILVIAANKTVKKIGQEGIW